MASPTTHPQGPDPTPVSIMIMDSEEKTADSDNIKEKPPLLTNEKSVSPNSSQEAALLVHPNDTTVPLRPFGSGGDHTVYPPNFFAPQAQTFYYGGYDNAVHEWDEYPPFYNAEGLEVGSAGVYNDNSSLVFHTGYGYSPQMPYGPYSPVTTPLPAVGGDTQLYSPQQFSFSGPPYYQQLVPPSGPYITSPTQVSQPELSTSINLDQRNENMLFGPSPGYPPQLGSFGRGNFPGNPGTIGFHDLQQGFDGLRSGGIWSDWSKPSDRQRPFTPLSPVVSPQPMGRLGSFGQNLGMTSQQQRSTYGFGSSSNSYNRGYRQSSFNQGSSFGGASPLSSLGMSSRGWLSLDNSRRPGRGTGSLCSCNATLDILSEQNRGPRASKPKSQITSERSSSVDGNNHDASTFKIRDESFNRPDFVTEYKDAKFFVIKSYSEDNIHKSIKYGVWASTPNGNKKLDAAYLEAKGKEGTCPVFLFFSVNASAQFCGVAEMVGRVDFDKSVDYWQHDKWSGQFPLKWHIIKDVPNNQFRHIILENNDNKPVTNSRDTQEVKLEQGVEMLSIFQSYETDTSILDDFDFYEDRQKAMQEQKARQQQANRISVGENEHQNAVTLSNDFIKHMSKSFAQVVRLEEGTFSDRPSSASEGTRVKLNDPITATVSSVPTI